MSGARWQVAALLLATLLQVQGAAVVRIVGDDIVSTTQYNGPIKDGARKVFLINQVFPRSGAIFAFIGYFKNTKPTHLQIWRPAGTDYQLLLDRVFTPSSDDVGKRSVIYMQGQQCIRILAGDRIGFMNEDNLASVGYTFMSKGLAVKFWSLTNTSVPQLYDTLTFDDLEMPYQFALAVAYDADTAYYDQKGYTCRTGLMVPPEPITTTAVYTTPDMRGPPGPQGPKGDKGEKGDTGNKGVSGVNGMKGDKGDKGDRGDIGNTGVSGDNGKKGDKGDRGEKGEQGKQGEPGLDGLTGPPGPQGVSGVTARTAAATDTDSCSACQTGLHHPNMILGLIIWLLIITLLVVMLIILMIRRRSELSQHDSLRVLQTSQPWGEDLREDVWKEYHVDTISNHPR